ncbi:hypothetical protein D3C84_928590 [compost metagenome]
MSAAARRSIATASKDLPVSVRSKKYHTPTKTSPVAAMMKKLWYEPASSPSSTRPKPSAGGTGCGSAPKPIEINSRNTTSMPSSASTGATWGAPFSTKGRTVSRSVSQPITSINSSTRTMATG